MTAYILRRLLRSVPVVVLVSILVFSMVEMLPGDPVLHMFAGQYMTAENMATARETLGLDQPAPVRYLQWVTRVFQGDFGTSIVSKRPVADMVLSVLPRTLELAMAAMFVTIVVGIALGVIAAIRQNSWIDTLVMVVASIGVAMPLFWSGLLALLYFSVQLRWFPVSQGASFHSLVLPAVVLGLQSACMVARLTRSSVLQVLREDYITTARAKGVLENRVVAIHALRNAFIPVFTLIGVQTSWLLGGTVITETVFARPGLGTMAVDAIRQMDFPVLQAIVLIAALIYTSVNLVVDIVNALVDPRIAYD
ncbi:oligopeptide transport system permease protein [Devosia enhydra]|uniref:Oligopeptide transport system permease protein n=1 Tax=Devosia enhydra TaxID=665118 RepID=A0A1K2HZM1_9HYPH|nr:ABC transporter permease [Devosia enhydra]SFZ85582.1 oligopeptide transport system permease protein [Devosia enhydra]